MFHTEIIHATVNKLKKSTSLLNEKGTESKHCAHCRENA
jgi:hypothetical protein